MITHDPALRSIELQDSRPTKGVAFDNRVHKDRKKGLALCKKELIAWGEARGLKIIMIEIYDWYYSTVSKATYEGKVMHMGKSAKKSGKGGGKKC